MKALLENPSVLNAYSPADLSKMQFIFDAAARELCVDSVDALECRRIIATAIFAAYSDGERRDWKLMALARAAVCYSCQNAA